MRALVSVVGLAALVAGCAHGNAVQLCDEARRAFLGARYREAAALARRALAADATPAARARAWLRWCAGLPSLSTLNLNLIPARFLLHQPAASASRA